ncbi:alpha/beta hydrolase fold domain-containing protein [Staphylococcus sp. FSL K6-3157]|uniref:alpha/beta hydrolase fold domain-containing protein n=1 Tax=Staphylococcus sp. FSL K6-3157 TaxID=2921490 RepID=UPI0030F4CAB2
MFSNEMEKYIKFNRQTKESTKGIELTPELILQARDKTNEMLGDIPTPKDIEYYEHEINGISGEFYKFTSERNESLNNKIVLFIHGGGFATASVASRRYLCTTALYYANMDGFSIEYSQYPEVQHPTAMTECIKVYKGLIEMGYKPENIYLLGESAGAALALTMTHYLKDNNEPLPGKICLHSPVVNINYEYESRKTRADRDPVIQSNINNQIDYFANSDSFSPYVSAIFGDFKGFPQLNINVGTEEVLWDDTMELEKKCKDADVDVSVKVWDGLFHVFPMFPTPESETALKYTGEFFAK